MANKNNKNKKEGLFWTPLGGNNIDQFSGNCHYYNLVKNDNSGKQKNDGVIIDLGLFDNYDGIADSKSESAFADVRDILKEKKAGAILLTHAHIDHIGAVSQYIRLGYEMPTIYAGKYTAAMLKGSFADFNIPYRKWPKIKEIDENSKIKIGDMEIEAVSVSHSVPDSFGFLIKSDKGNIFHTGDFKIDRTVSLGKGTDIEKLVEVGSQGINAMIADATTVHNNGYAVEEKKIKDAYNKLISSGKDRQVIIAISGGHMERYASIFKAIAENGRTVISAGTPYQKRHFRGLKRAGYDITFGGKVKIVDVNSKEAKKIKTEDSVIVTSGSYREDSYLSDALEGKKAPFKIEKNALIVIESRNIDKKIKENAEKLGAGIITSADFPDIAGSGHAQKNDMVEMFSYIKPKVLVPTHCQQERGEAFNQTMSKEGFNVLETPLNGMTFIVTKKGLELHDTKKANWVISNSVEDKKWQAYEIVVPQKPSRGKGGVPWRKADTLKKRIEAAKEIIANYKKDYDRNNSQEALLKAVKIKKQR